MKNKKILSKFLPKFNIHQLFKMFNYRSPGLKKQGQVGWPTWQTNYGWYHHPCLPRVFWHLSFEVGASWQYWMMWAEIVSFSWECLKTLNKIYMFSNWKLLKCKAFYSAHKNDVILVYNWSIKMYTGLPLVI